MTTSSFESILLQIKSLKNECTQLASVGHTDLAFEKILEALVILRDTALEITTAQSTLKAVAKEICDMEDEYNRVVPDEDARINLSKKQFPI